MQKAPPTALAILIQPKKVNTIHGNIVQAPHKNIPITPSQSDATRRKTPISPKPASVSLYCFNFLFIFQLFVVYFCISSDILPLKAKKSPPSFCSEVIFQIKSNQNLSMLALTYLTILFCMYFLLSIRNFSVLS